MFLRDNSVFVPVKEPNLSKTKTPMPVQPPEERVKNYGEVSLGYTPELAHEEASRCLKCPGRYCSVSCPAHVPTTEFIAKVRAGEYQAAYELISERNALPAITGRVCAQEKQCERDCTRGIRGESVSIGRLEAFVAFIAKVRAGEYQAAYELISERNPAPPASPAPTICHAPDTTSPCTRRKPSWAASRYTAFPALCCRTPWWSAS